METNQTALPPTYAILSKYMHLVCPELLKVIGRMPAINTIVETRERGKFERLIVHSFGKRCKKEDEATASAELIEQLNEFAKKGYLYNTLSELSRVDLSENESIVVFYCSVYPEFEEEVKNLTLMVA